MNVKADTIARTIIMVLALINQILAIMGKDKIPVIENDVYQICSLVATVCSTLWSWWKNNSFTKTAIAADKYKDKLKKGIE